MVSTETAILITQIPIAVAILIVAYELYKLRKDIVEILKRLSNK